MVVPGNSLLMSDLYILVLLLPSALSWLGTSVSDERRNILPTSQENKQLKTHSYICIGLQLR